MPHPKKILALASEPPQLYGGGVRTYHFLHALAKIAEVSLFVLRSEGQPGMPDDLRAVLGHVEFVPHPDPHESTRQESPGLGNRSRQAARPLLRPWSRGGFPLCSAAENHLVTRASQPGSGFRGGWRNLYRRLLETRLSSGIRHGRLLPFSSLLRSSNFRLLEPSILSRFESAPPDVIWFEHTFLFPLAAGLQDRFPEALLVGNAHNMECSLQDRLAEVASHSSARHWYQLQAEANRQNESEMMKQCDAIFCCSEDDARIARSLGDRAKVFSVANGVDTEFFQPGEQAAEPDPSPRLLFTGGMKYEPNQDAVRFFVREILPLIRKSHPDCRFRIAGGSAQEVFEKLAESDPGIEIASDVPDMRPHFEAADVVVVPLRAGSGTRTKILEAMSMARATVSTSLGAEGIPCTEGVHLRLADTPGSFARAVVELLDHLEKRQVMGNTARDLACREFDWSHLTSRAMNILKREGMIPTALTPTGSEVTTSR